jgi:hypothetical protein
MSSAFLDSVLALVVRTSTDLPPDVRAAMRVAMDQERDGTQSSQALAVIAQNIDLAADEEGRDLPGHRHAHVRGQDASRCESDRDEKVDP